MPVTVAALLATGKLVGPRLASFTAGVRNRWYRRAAADAVAAAPYPVPKRALLKALRLPGIRDLLEGRSADEAAAALAVLRGGIGRHRTWRDCPPDEVSSRCAEVLAGVQDALLRRLPTGDGLHTLDRRSESRHKELSGVLADIGQRLDDGHVFDERLTRLPPSMLGVEELRAETPRVADLVRVMAEDDDRAATLRAWVVAPPEWLSTAPPGAWVQVAEALQGVAETDAAIAAFRKAEDYGVTPVGYGAARAAWLLVDTDSVEALRTLATTLDGPNPHPLAAAAAAEARGDHRAAADVLSCWVPTNERDTDLTALFLCRCLVLNGDEDAAIRTLEGRAEATRSGAVPLTLARLLTSRAHRGRASAGRDADLRRAAELALRARDRTRAWRGPSEDAVIAAADALILGHDWASAWKVLRPSPDGVATTDESAAPAVRAKAAVAAAVMGRTALAHELAASTNDPFETAYLAAVIAEQEDQAEGVSDAAGGRLRDLWMTAYTAASTDEQRMIAARGLRALGETVPDYDELRKVFPDAVAEAEELAGVFALPPAERLARLRAQRHTTPYAAVLLADMLEADGAVVDSADALSDAADCFDDQGLRLMAARRLFDSGEHERARTTVETALAKAPAGWHGRRPSLAVLLDVASVQGSWGDAASHAQRLLELDAEDTSARWALAAALANLGQHEHAWDAVRQSPVPLVAQSKWQAALLLHLTNTFGDARAAIPEAVQLLRAYPDDEQFCAQVLGIIYGPRVSSDPTSEKDLTDDDVDAPITPDLAELHRATEDFFTKFPDNPRFRRIRFTTPEEIRERLDDELRPGAERRHELGEAVAAGRMPSGMLSAVNGRPYAELFARRAGGGGLLIRSPDTAEDSQEREALGAVLDGSSVIADASALHTLAVLPHELRDHLAGVPDKVSVTDDTLRDLVAARDSTGSRSTLFAAYDPLTGRTVFSAISDEDADGVARRTQSMLDVARRMASLRWPEMRHLTMLTEAWFRSWLGPLDAAKVTGNLLWCDDLALRRLARSEGVVAFGTTALIDVLVQRGELSANDREAALIELTSEWCADFEFDYKRVVIVASKAGWTPAAAAYALSRPSVWKHASAPIAVLRRAIANAPDPPSVGGWMHAAAAGLTERSPSPAAARENLERLTALILLEPRIMGPFVPAIVAGARAGAQRRQVDDPIEGALRLVHRHYLAVTDEDSAARVLLTLAGGLEDADRILAARVIVERR